MNDKYPAIWSIAMNRHQEKNRCDNKESEAYLKDNLRFNF